MYKDKNVIFKNSNINGTGDITEAYLTFMNQNKYIADSFNEFKIAFKNKPPEEEITCSYKKFRTVLSQNKIDMVNPASFEDMLRTQDYLETLDCIESIKYNKYVVNARHILQKYLYGGTEYKHYDISQWDICHIYKKLGRRSLQDKELIIISPKTNILKPSKSIRNHLEKFLSNHVCIKDRPYTGFGLFRIENSNTSYKPEQNKQKKRYYIQISDIQPFLLLFTLYDGRNFEYKYTGCKNIIKKRDYISPSRKNLRYSEYSYKIVLNKMDEIKTNSSDKIKDQALSIKNLWHCDQIFLSNKLNILFKYYKTYTSIPFLDSFASHYKLTYSENLNLKEYISEEIFKDTSFIIKGLQSDYLDFMMLFDIFIRYKSNSGNICTKNFDKLKNDISFSKSTTLEYLDCCPYLKYNAPGFPDNYENVFRLLNRKKDFLKPEKEIIFLEKEICSFLEKDKFFQFYYNNTDKDNFSTLFQNGSIKEYDFIDFGTILKAMDIPITEPG